MTPPEQTSSAVVTVAPDSGGAHFSKDWFSHNIPNWEKFIPKMDNMQYLEIGSYEGRSLLWMLQNKIGPNGRAVAVDVWRVPAIEESFDRNLEGYSGRVFKLKGPSINMVPHVAQAFNVAYVDGDHEARVALVDGALAFDRLKKGGILIFDDYKWSSDKVLANPREGINAFLNLWEGQYTLLHKGYQVIIQKR
jgi:hypothetical protein